MHLLMELVGMLAARSCILDNVLSLVTIQKR